MASMAGSAPESRWKLSLPNMAAGASAANGAGSPALAPVAEAGAVEEVATPTGVVGVAVVGVGIGAGGCAGWDREVGEEEEGTAAAERGMLGSGGGGEDISPTSVL